MKSSSLTMAKWWSGAAIVNQVFFLVQSLAGGIGEGIASVSATAGYNNDDGTPIDPKRLYNVATIDFLLSGGDGIAVGARAEDVKLTPVLMKDVMLDFIRAKEAAGEIIDYQKDGRVVMED